MIDQVRPGSRQRLRSCRTPPRNRKGYWAGGPRPPQKPGTAAGLLVLEAGVGHVIIHFHHLAHYRAQAPPAPCFCYVIPCQRSPFIHILQEIYSWLLMLKPWVTEDPWVGEEIPTSCSSAPFFRQHLPL